MGNFGVGRAVQDLAGPAEPFRGWLGSACEYLTHSAALKKQPAASCIDRPFGGGETGTSQQFWFNGLDGVVCRLSRARAATKGPQKLGQDQSGSTSKWIDPREQQLPSAAGRSDTARGSPCWPFLKLSPHWCLGGKEAE